MENQDINFAAIPQTAITVVTKPSVFFQSMPKSGGFLEPIVFIVAMGLIAGIIQAVLNFIGLGNAGGYADARMSGFVLVFSIPIGLAIVSFIVAAILFVVWKLMGSSENYEAAYRCTAYLMVLTPIVSIISVIPYAGGILLMAVYVFYLVAASIHVHNIPSSRAWLVFGIIGVILALGNVFAEHRNRTIGPEMKKWFHNNKEYHKSAKDMQKSTEDMSKQTEEMTKQFQKQMEEAKRKAQRD